MAEHVDTNDFDIILYLVQRILPLLVSTGICARIGHGTLSFEFKIANGKVTHSQPNISIGIRPDSNN